MGPAPDACATLQRRPRHDLAWIWIEFLSEQRRATDFVEPAGGWVVNDRVHNARARLKISLLWFHGKEDSVLLHMRACTSAYAFFVESVHSFRPVFWAPCMCRCVC